MAAVLATGFRYLPQPLRHQRAVLTDSITKLSQQLQTGCFDTHSSSYFFRVGVHVEGAVLHLKIDIYYVLRCVPTHCYEYLAEVAEDVGDLIISLDAGTRDAMSVLSSFFGVVLSGNMGFQIQGKSSRRQQSYAQIHVIRPWLYAKPESILSKL